MVRLTSDTEGSEVKTKITEVRSDSDLGGAVFTVETSPVFTWTFSNESKITLHFARRGFTRRVPGCPAGSSPILLNAFVLLWLFQPTIPCTGKRYITSSEPQREHSLMTAH